MSTSVDVHATTRPQAGPPRSASATAVRNRAPRAYSRSFAIVALGPISLVYAVFIALPIVLAVLLGFTDWNGVGAPKWVGLENWAAFFGNPEALHAVLVTLELAAASLVVQVPLTLALGLFIAGRQRYRLWYSVVFVLPMLVSGVGLSLMWSGMLDPNLGAIAFIGRTFHLDFLVQNWFGDATLTPLVLLGILTWQFVPLHMLIFQHGRRSIPEALYESAIIDGATPARQFFSITLPMLRHTVALNTALIVVSSLTTFDMIYVLTGGGPGQASNVLAMQMYKVAFEQNQFGAAAVYAVVLAFLGIALGGIVMAISGFNRFESEQEGIA